MSFDEFEVSEFTRNIPLDLIDCNDFNPNAMDDEAFSRLVEELQEAGRLIDPIQVVPMEDGRFRILGGEHRFRASQHLGWDTIPCTLLSEDRWQDVDLQKFVTVRLNVLKGKMNPEKMAQLYDEMAEKYGEESLQSMFAFTDKDAWEKLLKGIKAGIKRSLPKGIADKFDKVAKQAQSGEDLAMILNQLFAEYGDTVSQSFMVFTYGGKEHLYISMTPQMRKAMRRVAGFCQKHGRDINEVLQPLTDAWLRAVRKAEDAMPSGSSDDPIDAAEVDDLAF